MTPTNTLPDALGLLETTGLTPAMAALDVMEKSADIRILQVELNDLLGVCVKFTGTTAAVTLAMKVGAHVAQQMQGRPVADVIHRPSQQGWTIVESPEEFNPLIQQAVVFRPGGQPQETRPFEKEHALSKTPSFALGLIETQGFTAVFEAIDTACKAANVEVLGKEKLGGGYVTVIIKGDVAAVNAAIEAGRPRVEGLGKLIAAHVIARPSPAVLSLLPKT